MTVVLAIALLDRDVSMRQPKARQRAQADLAEASARQTLRELGRAPACISRTHSRGASAAAVSGAGALGVDLEYADPARPWRALLEHFSGEDPGPAGVADYCRAWTFIEAWYKAFGEWPPRGHVIGALKAAPGARQAVLLPSPVAAGGGGNGEGGRVEHAAAPDAIHWSSLTVDVFECSLISTDPAPPRIVRLPPVSF